jgi:predicted dehydrogenase
MALAALRVGAHVYLEKPITQTLAEADELLAIAQQTGAKIVVAHQMRLAPNILLLKKHIEDGGLGELLEIRAQGKQDHRAGGEDMIVLGVHIFNLMQFFAGKPAWCSARILQNGHEITLQDARAVTENIGPVAGDEIFAQFAFAKGVNASFTSRAKNREASGPMGLELVGSKGTMKILLSIMPTIWERKSGDWTKPGQVNEWLPWKNDPTLTYSEAGKSVAAANRRVVDDWLAAIAQNREPVCSGDAGMKALEMAMAVFVAGLSGERVYFPLKTRNHPLRA